MTDIYLVEVLLKALVLVCMTLCCVCAVSPLAEVWLSHSSEERKEGGGWAGDG